MRALLFISIALIIVSIFAFSADRFEYFSFVDISRSLAGIFGIESITEGELKDAYKNAVAGGEKIKVLIVPGHDNKNWGTEYAGLREADLTAKVGELLATTFKQNSAYEVTLLRDTKGYLPEFEKYFHKNKNAVRAETSNKKKIMKDLMSAGSVQKADGVQHNNAALDVALRLYAVNQWANENRYKIVLHLHFNDYGGRRANTTGPYRGFSIYVPDEQYSNARASFKMAESIFAKLSSSFVKSNLPKEDAGIVFDQDLIAVGSYNTLDAVGTLIEYAYIYESALHNPQTRPALLQTYAQKTYEGVNEFLISQVI